MLKKIAALVLCGAVVCVLTGCERIKEKAAGIASDISEAASSRYEEYKSRKEEERIDNIINEDIDPRWKPYRYADQVLYKIQRYLAARDSQALSDMFSEKYYASATEIEGLFDYFGEDITEFFYGVTEPGGGSVRYGEHIEFGYVGRFIAISESGVMYQVYFSGMATCDEEPKAIGLDGISVARGLDNSTDQYGVGGGYNEHGQWTDLEGNAVEPSPITWRGRRPGDED